MKALVAWNDDAQAELLALYLNNEDDLAEIHVTREEVIEAATGETRWDVILLGINGDEIDASYELFEELRRLLPDCPVVGACKNDDVFRIARFMTHGMRTYLIRDDAGDFVFMVHAILESTVEAVRAERERIVAEKLREEVDSVRKLQESIIPHDLATPCGYKVVARYESSQIRVLGGQPVVMAGGDYYDVFMLDDDSLVLLLGDASGHGMKACMSIMTMHTLIRMMRNDKYRDTATFVSEVNNRLCEQQIVSEEGGFITLLFGILNAESHEFQFTAAGHGPPLLHRLNENTIEEIGNVDEGGLPLAIYSDADYDVSRFTIPPHSRLLLYTDGIEEAFPPDDADHTEFGRAGIERVLKDCRQKSIDATLQALFDESHAFTGGQGRHDDTSIVLLERE